MRVVNIAMAMIVQNGHYYLQERTGPKEIGASGLVGCFGGKINKGESALQAIIRELPEETNITAKPGDLRQLDKFQVDSDHRHEPVKVNVIVFELILPDGFIVKAKEGELVVWTRAQIQQNENQLTPATKQHFRKYIK